MQAIDEQRILRDFGAGLRRLRLQRQFSQEALALVCGLDRTYIGSIERGERNVSLINICRISIALNVDVAELFFNEQQR
jgi:transcriptional regulator with XRE-family HTH domain